MGQMLRRTINVDNITVDTTAAASAAVDIGEMNRGMVYIPTGSGITTLTFFAAEKSGGTYQPAQTSAGAAVTLTVAADKCYPIPDAIFGAGVMKMTGNAAGVVNVSLKS